MTGPPGSIGCYASALGAGLATAGACLCLKLVAALLGLAVLVVAVTR
jgi:hypothetical protein